MDKEIEDRANFYQMLDGALGFPIKLRWEYLHDAGFDIRLKRQEEKNRIDNCNPQQ